eukprot:jgi/Botrbrau1/18305/Bobra.0179s0034.1
MTLRSLSTLSLSFSRRGQTQKGLTNAVLKEYVEVLKARQTQVLEAIYTYLQDAFSSKEGSAGKELQEVVELLQTVQGQDGNAAGAIAQLCRDWQAIIKQISEAQGAVSALSHLAEGQQQLAAFDAHLAAGEYSDAAAVAEQIGAACAQQPDMRDLRLLQAHRERLTALHEALEYEVAHRVGVVPDQRQLRVGWGRPGAGLASAGHAGKPGLPDGTPG